jgi:hypothetical protein
MAVTSAQIVDFLLANPGMTDAQIVSAMEQYGVSPAQMATAVGLDEGEVASRAAATVPYGQTVTLGDTIVQPVYQVTGSGDSEQIGGLENVITYKATDNRAGGAYTQYTATGEVEKTGTQQEVKSGLKEFALGAGLLFGLPTLLNAGAATGAAATVGTTGLTMGELAQLDLALGGAGGTAGATSLASALTTGAGVGTLTNLTGGSGVTTGAAAGITADSVAGKLAADSGLLTGTGLGTTVAGMGTGTGITTAGAGGLGGSTTVAGLGTGVGTGLTTTGAGLGTAGTGAGITAGTGLTGTGVLAGSGLGTTLLGTGTGALTGTGVLTGSGLGTTLLGTGAGTGVTGALTTGVGTGLATGLGTGALTTGVGTGVGTGLGTALGTAAGTGLGTGLNLNNLANLLSGGLGTAGSLLQMQQSKEAALAAQQRIDAETAAAKQAAAFRPVGMTTRFGTSQFQVDPVTGQLISAGYTLDPQAKNAQDRFVALAEQGLQQAEGAQAQFAPLQTGAQRLFGLGNEYLAQTPQDVAQNYLNQQMALLQPNRELELANLQNRLQQQGRGGLAVAQGGTMGATTPELQALFNARAQQEAQLAANAQQYGQQNVAFGAGLLGTGAQTMGNYYAGQQQAYAPYTTALGQVQGLEQLAQQPLQMGASLGQTASTAGARVGALGLEGANISQRLATGANATTNPYAQALMAAGNPNAMFGQSLGNVFGGLFS